MKILAYFYTGLRRTVLKSEKNMHNDCKITGIVLLQLQSIKATNQNKIDKTNSFTINEEDDVFKIE